MHSAMSRTLAARATLRRRRYRPPPRKPPPRQPIPLLAELKSTASDDPNAAVSLFFSSPPHLQDYPACSALLYRLARARSFDHVDALLGFLKHNRIPCNHSLFDALIIQYGKSRLPHKAVELFSSICSFNGPSNSPNTQTLNFLLNALVDNDDLGEAEKFLARSYSKLGIRPNVVSYNMIIKGWLKFNQLENARKVFDEMLRRNIKPSVVTYNIMISFMNNSNRVEESKRLMDEMESKGVFPNSVTYATLMEGLCAEGKYNEAKKLMFDMEYRCCKTLPINYGVLMSDRGRRGNLEEMMDLMAEMKRRKMKPDLVSYSILINYLCLNNRVDEAYKVFVDMQLKGCEPNAAIHRIMLDGFCKEGEFDKAFSVLGVMLASRHCPRLDTFKRLVIGLCSNRNGKARRLEDAWIVLEEMVKKKLGLDFEGWSVLVEAACQRLDDQYLLLDELIGKCYSSQMLIQSSPTIVQELESI